MKENKVSSRLSLELLSTLNINLARLSVLLSSSARSSRGFTIKSKVIVTCESMFNALSNAVTGHQEPEDHGNIVLSILIHSKINDGLFCDSRSKTPRQWVTSDHHHPGFPGPAVRSFLPGTTRGFPGFRLL